MSKRERAGLFAIFSWGMKVDNLVGADEDEMEIGALPLSLIMRLMRNTQCVQTINSIPPGVRKYGERPTFDFLVWDRRIALFRDDGTIVGHQCSSLRWS